MTSHKWLAGFYQSKINSPEITGLVEVIITTDTEGSLPANELLLLKITSIYSIEDMDTNKRYEIYRAQCVFNIPFKEVSSKDDIQNAFELTENNMVNSLHQLERSMKIPPTVFPNRTTPETHKEAVEHVYHGIMGK